MKTPLSKPAVVRLLQSGISSCGSPGTDSSRIGVRSDELFRAHSIDHTGTAHSLLLPIHEDDLELGIAPPLRGPFSLREFSLLLRHDWSTQRGHANRRGPEELGGGASLLHAAPAVISAIEFRCVACEELLVRGNGGVCRHEARMDCDLPRKVVVSFRFS